MDKMKRVKIPKYQVKALDEAIKKYARAVKAKDFKTLQNGINKNCSLCAVALSCHKCVYGKATNKPARYLCTDSWEKMMDAETFKDKIKWAKRMLKELRWIKRYQL